MTCFDTIIDICQPYQSYPASHYHRDTILLSTIIIFINCLFFELLFTVNKKQLICQSIWVCSKCSDVCVMWLFQFIAVYETCMDNILMSHILSRQKFRFDSFQIPSLILSIFYGINNSSHNSCAYISLVNERITCTCNRYSILQP